jgi:hypothetical protein
LCRQFENCDKNQKFFPAVSGFARLRGYTYEERFLSDDLETIGPGGTAGEFLGEIIDRHREMMFRTAKSNWTAALKQ